MTNIFKSFDDDSVNRIKKSEQYKKVSEDKNVKDFIENNQINEFREKYKDKSDDEILNEAKEFGKKLKEQYGEKEYNKKIQDLKNFEKFLNPEQKAKMKQFLDNLK